MESIVVTCPGCGQRFKAPESARGRQANCPVCKGALVIGAAEPLPAARPEDEDAPARPVARRDTGRRTKPEPEMRRPLVQMPGFGDDPDLVARRPGGDTRRHAGDANLRDSGVRRLREAGLRDSQIRRGAETGEGESAIRRTHGLPSRPSGPPWLWIGVGAGGLCLVAILGIGISTSQTNARVAEEKRERAVKVREETERRRQEEAERKALLATALRGAREAAEQVEKKERETWNAFEASRAGGATQPFRSERAAKRWCEAAHAAESAGETGLRDKYFRRAAECDVECAEAHQALDHVKYTKPAGEDIDTLALEGLLVELDPWDQKWVDRKQHDEVRTLETKVLAAARAEMTRRATDPYYATIQQVRTNIGSQEVLKELKFRDLRSDPYLVFEQRLTQGADDPAAETRLFEKVKMLRHLEAWFDVTFAKPMKLERDRNEPLKVIALRDRSAFDDYNKKKGIPMRPGTMAYYDPTNEWVILYNGAMGGGDAEAQKVNEGVVFHEGSHQLVDAYVNRGKGGTERIPRSRWFDEGFAEWIGSIEVQSSETGKTWALCQKNDHRLGEIAHWRSEELMTRRLRGQKCPPLTMTLGEMIQCYTYQDVSNTLLQKMPRELREALAKQPITSLVYATSVNFFYFCRTYENGKYWPRLEAYLKWEWGLDPSDPPVTGDSLRRFQAALQSRDQAAIREASPQLKCVRAFQRAFAGIDFAVLEKEFWAFINPLVEGATHR